MERVEMVVNEKRNRGNMHGGNCFVHSPIFSGRVSLIGKSQWLQGEMEKKARKYA